MFVATCQQPIDTYLQQAGSEKPSISPVRAREVVLGSRVSGTCEYARSCPGRLSMAVLTNSPAATRLLPLVAVRLCRASFLVAFLWPSLLLQAIPGWPEARCYYTR